MSKPKFGQVYAWGESGKVKVMVIDVATVMFFVLNSEPRDRRPNPRVPDVSKYVAFDKSGWKIVSDD